MALYLIINFWLTILTHYSCISSFKRRAFHAATSHLTDIESRSDHVRLEADLITRLVDLLDVGAAAAAAAGGSASGHTAGHTAGHATHAAAAALRVERLHDRRADALNLLLLVLELLLLGKLVGLEPRERVVDGLLGLRLVVVRQLVLHLLVAERVLHRVAVVLEAVLGLDLLLELLVLLGVLLGV